MSDTTDEDDAVARMNRNPQTKAMLERAEAQIDQAVTVELVPPTDKGWHDDYLRTRTLDYAAISRYSNRR